MILHKLDLDKVASLNNKNIEWLKLSKLYKFKDLKDFIDSITRRNMTIEDKE